MGGKKPPTSKLREGKDAKIAEVGFFAGGEFGPVGLRKRVDTRFSEEKIEGGERCWRKILDYIYIYEYSTSQNSLSQSLDNCVIFLF